MIEIVLENQERSDASMKNLTELVGSHTASIQKLEMQMRDLSREQNQKQKGTLPSDIIANLKGSWSGPTSHYMAITTQSGKLLQSESERVAEVEDVEQEDESQVEVPNVIEVERTPKKVKAQDVSREEVEEKVIEAPKPLALIPRPPPFPQRLARRVDDSKLDKFYDILKQLSDLGAFTISCTIGLRDFARALCDNGDIINLMPIAIYKQVVLGIPRPTSMRLQMANCLIKRPVGIVDDVLVNVGKFLLPANFVILDCSVDKEIPIILGRSFLATGRAIMDSKRNEIKFQVNDEEVTFQASKGMKLPNAYESISVIDVVDVIEDAV
nr:PREDICTED: uncharacterized protein LOC107832239 [Nicotiana tabacum]